jgi:tetratricopeptide (TPR) repeat protein
MLPVLGILLTSVVSSVTGANPPNFFVSQQATSISGHVSDDRNNPIADLKVELLDDVDSVIQRTKTDNSGLYSFRRLTHGIFQVKVQTYGTAYQGQTQRVQLESGRAFEQVDFVLVKGKSSFAPTTPGVIFVQEVPAKARKEFERGELLLQKTQQRKEALAIIEKAIEIFPLYFDALHVLGTEYVKDHEYDRAIPVLTKAAEVNKRIRLFTRFPSHNTNSSSCPKWSSR